MKAKVGRGGGFRGVLEYALQASKGASIIGGTMGTTTSRVLAAEFAVSRQQRPEVQRPVWHCSLSLPRSDVLDEQGWLDVATDFMAEMGMPDHQYIVVRHADTAHDHVHIIASRIGLDSSIWHGKWEARQAIEATQRLEQRHGLTVTPGLDDAPRERKSLTKNEIEQFGRTGEVPVRKRLQHMIDDAIAGGSLSVTALCERLEFEGVEVRPNVASTGKLNGLSFSLDGVAFKGSQLGKGYTWSQLQKKGVSYEPDTEYRPLSRRAASFDSRADPEHSAGASGADAGNRGDDQSPAPVSDGDHQRDHVSDGSGHGGDPSVAGSDRPGGLEPDRAAEDGRAVDAAPDRSDRGVEVGGERAPAARGPAPEPDQEDGELGGSGSQNGELVRLSGGDGVPETGWTTGEDDRAKHEARDLDLDGGDAGRGSDWHGLGTNIADLAAGSPRHSLGDGGNDSVSPAVAAKQAVWRRQHGALDAPAYRLTLTSRRDHLKSFNHGKGKGPDGGERFYSAAEVEGLLPYLSRQNARGYDIYVTPIDPAHHYLVVDDMTEASHAQLVNAGYQPALVQESSKDNRQAILKVPRLDAPDEQKAANRVVQMINRNVGDPKFSDAIHPFRVAGFSNKKPEKDNAFTRILKAASVICQRTAERLQQARDWLAAQRSQLSQDQQIKPSQAQPSEPGNRSVAPNHAEGSGTPADEYRRRTLRQSADADWSRVDFGVAVGMLADGWQPHEVEQAIIGASPAIRDRHSDVERYARRTVEKAGETPDGQMRDSEPKRPAPQKGSKRDPGMSM